MLVRLTIAVLLIFSGRLALAETVYVTDSLRLGLYATEDGADKPVANLVSGTELEVLERGQGYARVRTPGGQEGWVKAAFLVTEKPAVLRVAELEAELDSVRGAMDKARSEHAAAAQARRDAQADAESQRAAAERLARLERENEDYLARLESYRRSLPLPWVGAALAVALAAGFVSGLWWLDALIRRRHGGFRVY